MMLGPTPSPQIPMRSCRPPRMEPDELPFIPPKDDVMFKLLFAATRNERLLISLLTAVLRPPSPIVSARVLNPRSRRSSSTTRASSSIFTSNSRTKTRLCVEMQRRRRKNLEKRLLYSFARVFGDGIVRGQDYEGLEPVKVIAFLDATLAGRFHAIYRLLEVHDHVAFTDAIEVHVVELRRARELADEDGVMLGRWARFLGAEDAGQLQSSAQEDPTMTLAKQAHEELSRDPTVRALVEARHMAEVNWRLMLNEEREEGLAQGREQGREQGLEEGRALELRAGIVALSEVLGLEVSEARRAELERSDIGRLETIKDALRTDRAWPPARQ